MPKRGPNHSLDSTRPPFELHKRTDKPQTRGGRDYRPFGLIQSFDSWVDVPDRERVRRLWGPGEYEFRSSPPENDPAGRYGRLTFTLAENAAPITFERPQVAAPLLPAAPNPGALQVVQDVQNDLRRQLADREADLKALREELERERTDRPDALTVLTDGWDQGYAVWQRLDPIYGHLRPGAEPAQQNPSEPPGTLDRILSFADKLMDREESLVGLANGFQQVMTMRKLGADWSRVAGLYANAKLGPADAEFFLQAYLEQNQGS